MSFVMAPKKAFLGPSFLSVPHTRLAGQFEGVSAPSHFENPSVSASRSRYRNPSWHAGVPSVGEVSGYVVGRLPANQQEFVANVRKLVF